MVHTKISGQYHDWLTKHIKEMLALPGFVKAEWFEVSEPRAPQGEKHWCVHYYLENQSALDNYLETYAPNMRQDGIDKFGDEFRATRRVLRQTA